MGLLEEYKKQKAAGNQNSNSLLKQYQEKKRAESIDTEHVDQSYVNSFLKDANSFLNKTTADGSELSAWNDLKDRADTVDAWFFKNKDSMSQPEYIRMATTLGRFANQLNEKSGYWSQFDSEEAYQSYLADEAKRKQLDLERDQMLGFDTASEAKKIDELNRIVDEYYRSGKISTNEGLRELITKFNNMDAVTAKYGANYFGNIEEIDQYDTLLNIVEKEIEGYIQSRADELEGIKTFQKYENVKTADDFENYSKMGEGIANPTYDAAQGFLQIGTWRPFGEEIGNIVTFSRDNYDEIVGAIAENGGDGSMVLGDYLYNFMTEEEVGIYNYYLAKYGKEQAEAYLDYIYDDLKGRHKGEVIQNASAFADDHPILGSALSVLTSLGSGVEYMGDVFNHAIGRDEKLDSNWSADITNAIRGTVSEKTSFEIAGWDAGKFLYNTAMSGADSLASSFMGNAGGAMLGLSAAAQGTNEALARGMSDRQAFWNGLFSGVAEGLFESLSIGNFNALKEVSPHSIKEIAKNIGKSMLVNASEETLTEVSNIAYDTLVNGAYANYTIDDLKRLGTWAEIGGQIAESALSGALMGAGFGTIGSASGYVSNQKSISQLAQDVYGGSRENMQALVSDLLRVNSESSLGNRLQKKLDAGKSLSGRELAQIAEQISAAIDKKGGEESARTDRDDTEFEDLSPALEALLAARENDSTATGNNTAEGASVALERERNLQEERWLEWERERYQELGRTGKDFATAREAMEKKGDARIPSAEAFRIYTEAQNEAATEAAADRVKVTVTESGEDSSVVRVTSTASGRVIVELDGGNRVAVSDITFASPDSAVLYNGAATMNVASANQMIEGFDGSSDALNYVRGWQEAYNSARYGIDLSESRFASGLTEEQLEAATKAGKADRNRERATVGENRTEKRKGTLHREADTSSLSEAQAATVEALERLTQALGIDIYLYQEANSTHNGWYDRIDGSIHLNLAADLSAEGTLLFTAAHELTHYMRDYAPDKFGTLADFLLTQYGEHGVSVSELVERQMGIAEADGRQIDYDTAFEEVVASSMETMLQSGNVVEAVAKLKAKDQTLWEKFAEYFRDLAKRLRKAFQGLTPTSREGRYVGAMKDAAERLEALFTDALVTASERERTKNTAEGGVRYQARQSKKDPRQLDPRTVTKSDVVELLENAQGGAIYGNTYIPIRINTPACLIYWARERRGEIIDNNPIAMSAEKAYQAMARKGSDTKGRPHMLSVNDMVSIIEGMSDPQYIVYQGANDRYVEVVNYSTSEGRKAFAILEVGDAKDSVYMNGYEGGLYNILVTTYPPDAGKLQDLLKNPSNEIVYDKKKDAPQRTSGSTVPSVLNDTPFFNDSIPHESDSVKRKFSTSERGNDSPVKPKFENVTESQQFKRWFGDWQNHPDKASKVVNDDGTPKVMYHGSANQFTVFDKRRAKASGTFGKGFYFSDSNSHAGTYGALYEVYLNIRHPLQGGKTKVTTAQIRKFLEAVAENEDYSIENYGTYNVEEILRKVTSRDAFAVIRDINTTAIGDFSEAIALFNEVCGTGFDGIITETETVVFEPTQIKSATDNIGSFDKNNPDIRYSTDSADIPTLQADNAALRADNDRLVQLLNLQRTEANGTRFTEESVRAASKRLMDWAGARGDVRELAGMLHSLYEYIARGQNVAWDTIRERSEPIVNWLSAHRKNASERDPEVQDLRRYLRPLKVKLSDAQRRQVEALYGSYNEYRKQLFGTVNLSKEAPVTLDELWSEMADQFPGIFDASEVDTDMPGILLDVVKSMRENRLGNEMELALDAMIEQGLYQQVYESYWDAATMRSLGEVTDRKMAELKREHKKQMDNLRLRRNEQIERIRKETELERAYYRKRALQREAEAREHYRKSLDNYRDSRERTELRRKAYKVYRELLTMLKDPTKTKHILPELQKAVAEALKVVDMDSVNAAERIERLQIKLKDAKTDVERERIERSIARIESASEKVAERLGVLEQAYKAVLASPEYADEYGAEEILRRIEALKVDVKDTTFVHLDRHQLQKLYELFVVTRTQVRNANRLFDEKRNTSVVIESNKGQNELVGIGKDKNPATDRFAIFRRQEWNNLKPIYAMEKLGSSTMRRLFDGLLRGESKYGVDMKENRDFFQKTVEESGYFGWDHDQVTHHESSDGKPFALTLLQKMSLYAYERRGEVALRHIEGGGLTFGKAQKFTKEADGKKVDYYVRYGDRYPLTRLQVHEITETLTPEQKQFVEKMQEYLSKDMGAKGNEVARVLYGIDLFGEQNYFPMQTVDGGKDQSSAPVDLVKLREMGMTQKTQAQASNSLMLGDFTDVWANHCHQMSLYHSMVLPLEDFTRVWNYSAGGRSVKNEVESIYGKEAVAYVEDLLKQLNGGVRADSVELAYSKWLSGFKKAATFASLSVVIQQRSAIARAYGEILPQYFRKGKKMRRSDAWEELQKYAGCAGIKEMGGFDTGTGGGSAEWLIRRKYDGKWDSFKGMFNFKDSSHRDEVLSRLPAWMDEVTWCDIWRAVKAETTDRNPSLQVGSEAFLKAAGERFTEVIAKTQVYDSVLARSANMRSKGGLMKMMTAFMAEPTTTINMFGRGIWMMTDPKTKGKGVRYCASVVAAAVYNAALVSVIYAMRDDDEDETYLEKYLSSFLTETVDSMNPLGYLPFYKDIMSILQGWDVARSDMTLFTRAKDALLALNSAYEDGDASDQAGAWVNFAATLTDFFGLPVRNIIRDVKAGFNFVAVLKEDFSGRGTTLGALGDQVQEGLRQLAPLSDVYWDKDTKSDKLYSAIVNGDEAYYQRMADNYENDSALQSAIRKGLRENEPRISEAAKAYLDGDMEEYTFLIEQIAGEGKFDEETVRASISAEIGNEREDARGEDTPDTDDLADAYDAGDSERALEIIEELIAEKVEDHLLKAQAEAYENGDSYDEEDAKEEADSKARSSVRSFLTRYWKPLYVEAYQSGDVDECELIEDTLNDTGLYGNAKALRKTLKSWRTAD